MRRRVLEGLGAIAVFVLSTIDLYTLADGSSGGEEADQSSALTTIDDATEQARTRPAASAQRGVVEGLGGPLRPADPPPRSAFDDGARQSAQGVESRRNHPCVDRRPDRQRSGRQRLRVRGRSSSQGRSEESRV